jgi:sugar transferase (PEP-CTERM system associated)
MGLYRREALVEIGRTASRLPLVLGMGATTSLVICFLAGHLAPETFLSRGGREELLILALAYGDFLVCAFAARGILDLLLRKRLLRRRLLIVGAGQRAQDLSCMLRAEGSSVNYDIVYLHDAAFGTIDPRLQAQPDVVILLNSGSRILDAAMDLEADQIVVAPDERRGMDLEQLLFCKKAGYPVVQYLSFVENEIRRVDVRRLDLGWLVFSEGFYYGALDRFLKRAFDLSISLILLVATAPLLLAGMLAIKLEGPGPVFYRQERITLNGRIFRILKLRTMCVDAEAGGAVWAGKHDSRITRSGAFLRRTRIDELPQLLNILKGEMSFVGPRPERPMFVKELSAQIPLFNERHMVKAGLTGWAQVNYPYGASVEDAWSKLSYDLYYVKNFSILFDVLILLQTLRVVLWPSGVR